MTSALHAEGPRFDPGVVYVFEAGRRGPGYGRHLAAVRTTICGASLAQMVERKTLNLVVVGSIPTGGAFWHKAGPCSEGPAKCGPREQIHEQPL